MERSPLQAFWDDPSEARFRPLFERTKGLVYTVVRRVLGPATDDVEDAFQGTYIRLLQQARDKTGPAAPPAQADEVALLGRLAYLEADRIRHQRSRRRKREVLVDTYPERDGGEGEAREAVASREIRDRVQEIVAGLPEKYRLPIQLHFFHGLTHRQIAEVLDIPIGTISSQIKRGLALLERPMRRAGLEGAAGILALMMAGAQFWTPPAAYSAEAVFTAAQTATGAQAGASAAAGHGLLTAKLAAVLGGAAVIGTLAVVGWVQLGPNRSAGPMPPSPPEAAQTVEVAESLPPIDSPASTPLTDDSSTPLTNMIRGAKALASLRADEPTPPPESPARVAGHVYDFAGHGMPDVQIRLTSFEAGGEKVLQNQLAVTDASGAYEAGNVVPGDVLVRVVLDDESPLYAVEMICRPLKESEDALDVDFHLLEGGSIYGRVRNQDAEGIPGARVELTLLLPDPRGEGGDDVGVILRHQCACLDSEETQARFLTKRTLTDDEGYYILAGIHPKAKVFRLGAEADEYYPYAFAPVAPFEGSQDMVLSRAGNLRLVVREEVSKAPIANFRYRLVTDWGRMGYHPFMQWGMPKPSDPPGEATIERVPPGQWQVEVVELDEGGNPTGRRAEVVVETKPGDDVLELFLGANRLVTGTVVGPDDEPVRGAVVQAYPWYITSVTRQVYGGSAPGAVLSGDSESAWLGSATTDSEGWFQIDGLSAGMIELVAEKDRLVNAERVPVEVPSADDAEPVRIRLVPSARLFGQVTGTDGEPMQGVRIQFMDDEQQAGRSNQGERALTDAHGSYEIRNLRPDVYRVHTAEVPSIFESVQLEPGEERELNFDYSGKVVMSGALSVEQKAWDRSQIKLFLRPQRKGYPNIWAGDTGSSLEPDAEDPKRYRVELSADSYFLWAVYPDARALVAEAVEVPPSPREQTRDIHVRLADVSVVVLTPDAKPYDLGVVCFDQRLGSFQQPRSFSMSQKERQGYFPDMVAGEYKVNFTATDSSLIGESDWVAVGPGKDNVIVIDTKPADKGEAIGGWDPTTITQTYKDHRYPVTSFLQGPGEYQVTVLYEWGPTGVRVESVALLENGMEITRDTHEGWSGTGKRNHIYVLPLFAPKMGVEYSVVVRMLGDGGISSRGTVYLKKLEPQD